MSEPLQILDYPLYTQKISNLSINRKMVINTINQYSLCVAQKDPEFKTVLQASDILLPDGVGITAAAKFLTGKTIKKIAGADLHDFLLQKLNNEKGRCFYLGSSSHTLKAIAAKLKKDYPNITVGFHSPPFKKEFSLEDNETMLTAVNNFKPDALFIGMTAPKQEKWSYIFKETIDAKLICSIGAVFDYYAGTVKRPGKLWIQLNLEWLGRLCKEPKRLWRRYLYYGPIYLMVLLRAKIFQKIQNRHLVFDLSKRN